MKKIFFTIGTLATSVAIYYVVLWIYLFHANTGTREELIELYLSYYPKLVRGTILLTFFDIMICSISVLCFLYVRKLDRKTTVMSCISYFLLIVNFIIIAWLFFTLM
ncbi:MAG: hypothetical protein CRN43_09725 [Candidatus Nephrothrix sp. EaCA]|nr:MAG: hypothetical protein CRN43_09725 [Candidatus Nephrothrix sp. EaCA]